MTTVFVFVLWLALILGCVSTGPNNKNAASSKPPGKCQPLELTVKTPDGGNLVDSVAVRRDDSGTLTAKWRTTLPAGTESMIDVGLWRPEPKKDIPNGPLLDGAGSENTSCDGTIITTKKPFDNDGSGFNQGQYYLALTVIDNEVWKQPQATKDALAAAKGKVKGLTKQTLIPGLGLDLTARFELPPCEGLPPTVFKPRAISSLPSANDSSGGYGVTLAGYNHIKTGMTYAQVVKILGEDGVELSSNDIGGYRTVMYQWKGEDGISNMNAMFQNGRLISKAQFGLR